jgi:hypothetical protein
MTDLAFPSNLVCPISQDLMNDPVKVSHKGSDYFFDRSCIETWKTTPNGDQNPLTMLDGFRDAPCVSAEDIKTKVKEFRLSNGLETEVTTEKVKLEPFSDYQQIQDDEAEARRLHRELNGPSESEIPNRIIVSWLNRGERYIQRTIDIPPFIGYMFSIPEFPRSVRESLMNAYIQEAMDSYERENPPVYGPDIPDGGLPVEDTSNNFMGFRSGFLN